MSAPVDFFVPGVPAPQGSKRAVTRGREVVLIEMSKRVKPWRQAVATVASLHPPLPAGSPLHLVVTFRMPRPKAHYGTGRNAAVLKASAPSLVARTPDLDKLLRSTCDGLTESGLIGDDSLIVAVTALKRYADGARTGAHITVGVAVEAP